MAENKRGVALKEKKKNPEIASYGDVPVKMILKLKNKKKKKRVLDEGDQEVSV
jgi:hypothetical protein